jgi:hypothetical protein
MHDSNSLRCSLNANTIPTTAELIHAIELQGFVAGPPLHLRSWAIAVDELVCASARCPFCDRLGLAYLPFRRSVGRSFDYRAIASCQCGHGFEF